MRESQWICQRNSVSQRHKSKAKSKGESEFDSVTVYAPNVNQRRNEYQP